MVAERVAADRQSQALRRIRVLWVLGRGQGSQRGPVDTILPRVVPCACGVGGPHPIHWLHRDP